MLFTAFVATASRAKAQNVSLDAKATPLYQVFKKIEKQTGYLFWYKGKMLGKNTPITVSFTDLPLKTALDKIFTEVPFTYEIVDETIVVKDKPAAKESKKENQQKKTVTGTITDEKGEPLAGATVKVKGTENVVLTDQNGRFLLKDVNDDDIIQIIYVGYTTKEVSAQKELGTIKLQQATGELQNVEIVSTGYQNLPKERATGSFVQINNALLNRRISTNILDRLEGIASGLVFNKNNLTSNEKMGITIRGRSTIDANVNANPLVVLDNFPYEGDLANINPNDIESITILKDAAAASIWGARAGNGVIVLTSKKGTFNSLPTITANTNLTIGSKPDLFYSPNFVNSADYINAETYLFNQGFFDSDLTNINKPMVSPVIDLLAKKRANPTLGTEVDAEIDRLKSYDVRNDYDRYVYRKSINQQYAIGINGGSNNIAYNISFGYDNNKNNLIRNGYNRLTLNSQTTFQLTKKLELTTGINYFHTIAFNNTDENAYGAFSTLTNKYGTIYPYARLADDFGNPVQVSKQYQQSYIDNMKSLGFLDYTYKPLNEIEMADNTTRSKNLLLKGQLKYKFTSFLSAQVQYQNESQTGLNRKLQNKDTYDARFQINRFAQRNNTTGIITYPFPLGSILTLANTDLNSHNFRTQANYNQNFGEKHIIAAIAGAEIREIETSSYSRTSLGYNDELGTAVTNINYGTSYTINPTGSGTISGAPSSITGRTNRLVSYYTNASYTYDTKYTLSLSARKDGANIFGVKTNDRITPLWSAGLAWEISKENFYPFEFLPYAKLRTTYGFNGNVYNASAYLTFGLTLTNTLTGLRYATVGRAPNSDLSWERVKNINIGIDFATKNNIISGTIELYHKDGLDLIQSTPLAPSTGFTSFFGNAASNRTKGIDLTLNSKNLNGKLKWNTTLLFSQLKDKITYYDTKYTAANLVAAANQFTTAQSPVLYPTVGKSLFGVYGYQWAGLDPNTGDPQGYLNGATSKDYLAMITNATPDNIVYFGSARPTMFGALMNNFSYKNFNLSVNITYKLGYYFRRTSTGTNVQSTLLKLAMHSDYVSRWQKSGDELTTDVPSIVYPANNNREIFYQNSTVLVEPADHIRMQDIGFGYTFNKAQYSKLPFRSLQFNLYANNIGLLWTENKKGLDPDFIYMYTAPNPRMLSIGLKGTF